MELHHIPQEFEKRRVPRVVQWRRKSLFAKIMNGWMVKLSWEWQWRSQEGTQRQIPWVKILRGFNQVGEIQYFPDDLLDRAPEASLSLRLPFSAKYSLFLCGTLKLKMDDVVIHELHGIPFDPALGFIFPGKHGDIAIADLWLKLKDVR